MKAFNPKQYSEGKLPVFVFPTTLEFHSDDQSSLKQVLTLYNPYEFTIQFKVLCNNPTKYNVVESEGLIKEQCCVDIVIRAIEVQPGINREDKFRIQLYEHGLTKLLGRKDVVALLSSSDTESVCSNRSSTKRGRRASIQEKERFLQYPSVDPVIVERSLPSVPVVLLAILCIAALMLPSIGEDMKGSKIPVQLHLSLNQKLLAAFMLGLITMAVLKP